MNQYVIEGRRVRSDLFFGPATIIEIHRVIGKLLYRIESMCYPGQKLYVLAEECVLYD